MSAPPPSGPVPTPPRPSRRLWAWFGLVGALLAANLFAFVAQNGVALPYADQWDLHEMVWRNAPAGELFDHQHGPHRQGLFFPLTALVLRAAQGDIRIEGLWIAAWLVLAAALALGLARRLTSTWHFADVLPLAWCLSLRQYETITTTGNLSHSIGPLVLVLSAGHALATPSPWRRWPLAGLAGAALVFTGFGVFGGAVLTALALVAAVRDKTERWPAATAFGLLALAWAVFLSDYHFNPAAPDFRFPHYPLWDYVPFLSSMLAAPFGFTAVGSLGWMVGALVGLGGLVVVGRAGWVCLQRPVDRRLSALLVLFAGTALVFALNTAVGRVQLGAAAGMASRYTSLLVPLAIAFFLVARSASPGFRRTALLVLALLTLWPYRDLFAGSSRLGTWGLPRQTRAEARLVLNEKLAWLQVYSTSHDVATATHRSRASIYPDDAIATLPPRLAEWVRARRAPFRHGPAPSDFAPFAGAPPVFVGFEYEDEGSHWLADWGQLVVDGTQGAWLNFEWIDAIPGLPLHAPLVFEFAGRTATVPWPGQRVGFSLPLGSAPGQVVTLNSPTGTRRPADPVDQRDLSFRFGRVTVDAVPLYSEWTPIDKGTWGPTRAISERHGLHPWEDHFGWMADSAELTVETTAASWLNLRCTGRFPSLPGRGGLCVSVDGGQEVVMPMQKGRGAVSVQLPPPGRHQIRLRSEDGAISPQSLGLSGDTRALSYRFDQLDLTATPAFTPLVVSLPTR